MIFGPKKEEIKIMHEEFLKWTETLTEIINQEEWIRNISIKDVKSRIKQIKEYSAIVNKIGTKGTKLKGLLKSEREAWGSVKTILENTMIMGKLAGANYKRRENKRLKFFLELVSISLGGEIDEIQKLLI